MYKTYIGTVIFLKEKFNANQPYLYIDKNNMYFLSYNNEVLETQFDNKIVEVTAMESPDKSSLWVSDIKEFKNGKV